MSYSKSTIVDTVNKCSYNKEYNRHIAYNIETIQNKNLKNFTIQIIPVNTDHLLKINLEISCLFDKKYFNIPISIFIPPKFPYFPPDITLIRNVDNIIVNQNNQDIDPLSWRIYTKSIRNWVPSISLANLIDEITLSFNANFPIFLIPPGQNIQTSPITNFQTPKRDSIQNINDNYNSAYQNPHPNVMINNQVNPPYDQKNYYSINDQAKLKINDEFLKEKFDLINEDSTKQNINTSYGSANTDNSSNSNKRNENDTHNLNCVKLDTKQNSNHPEYYSSPNIINMKHPIKIDPKDKIKEFLVEKLKENLKEKLISQYMELNKTTNRLNYAKAFLDNKASKLNDVIQNSDDILESFQKEYLSIQQEIDKYKTVLSELKDKNINKENCYEYISLDEKFYPLAKILSSEATIEDTIIYLKRGFEKKAVNFDETIRSIRLYSRELLKLKFYRDKQINKLK